MNELDEYVSVLLLEGVVAPRGERECGSDAAAAPSASRARRQLRDAPEQVLEVLLDALRPPPECYGFSSLHSLQADAKRTTQLSARFENAALLRWQAILILLQRLASKSTGSAALTTAPSRRDDTPAAPPTGTHSCSPTSSSSAPSTSTLTASSPSFLVTSSLLCSLPGSTRAHLLYCMAAFSSCTAHWQLHLDHWDARGAVAHGCHCWTDPTPHSCAAASASPPPASSPPVSNLCAPFARQQSTRLAVRRLAAALLSAPCPTSVTATREPHSLASSTSEPHSLASVVSAAEREGVRVLDPLLARMRASFVDWTECNADVPYVLVWLCCGGLADEAVRELSADLLAMILPLLRHFGERARLLGLAALQRVLQCARAADLAFNRGVFVDALLAMLVHAEQDAQLKRVCVLLSRLLHVSEALPASTPVRIVVRRLLAEMARPHRASQRTLLLDVVRVRLLHQHLNAVQFLPALMPVLSENARWGDAQLSAAVLSLIEVLVAQLWIRLPAHSDSLLCALVYIRIDTPALSARCTHLVALLQRYVGGVLCVYARLCVCVCVCVCMVRFFVSIILCVCSV
jgi:hypothetical protein